MPKQNPFSPYDFLGYFTPGALLLYGLLALWSLSAPDRDIWQSLVKIWTFEKPQLFIPFILAAYAAGHIINFVSSITVESYCIWALGYPSKFLLGNGYPNYFIEDRPISALNILRAFVWLILLPITVTDLVFGRLFHLREFYAKRLDPWLTEAIKLKNQGLMTKHAGLSSHEAKPDYDSFRYIYHWSVEHAPNHLAKMQNYVALYGFLRSLTLLSVAGFWSTGWLAIKGSAPLLLPIAVLFGSYVLYTAFIKFYRRFSLEALMALTVSYRIEACESNK